ncbi:MAG: DNA-protecting protein DprA [Alphaproteobacteria bacterium]|nr:MAG: DNA-protecting protein DprA [Alphaproteobacteria bacterium]
MTPPHCLTTLECIKTKGIGPKKFWDILKFHNNDIERAKTFIVNNGFKIPDVSKIIKTHKKLGIQMLCFCDKRYPKSLSSIHNPPPVLFYKGNLDLLNKNTIAIVGARNASYAGQNLSFKIAQTLAEAHDITVVSGLAKGIDTSAHKGSFERGCIAVVAQGLDIFYPPENTKLYKNILDNNGLILSELEAGIPPNAFSFPVRNRIIAGLSKGIVIIEAAFQSGTLSTAKSGVEFGKDIFVVPGSPFDPRYKGSHKLIKDGAILVENANDIVEHLNLDRHGGTCEARCDHPMDHHGASHLVMTEQQQDDDHIIFNAMIINEPISLEELSQHLKLTPQVLLSALTQFEIEGKIQKHPDGRFLRRT